MAHGSDTISTPFDESSLALPKIQPQHIDSIFLKYC